MYDDKSLCPLCNSHGSLSGNTGEKAMKCGNEYCRVVVYKKLDSGTLNSRFRND